MSGNAIAQNLVAELDSSLNPALKDPLVGSTLPSGSAVVPPFDPLSAPINPNPPEPSPAPLRPRSIHSAQTDGSLRRFGALAKLFPGAEKLRVYKLDETLGQWSPIGEWPLRTVQHSRDLDGFMMEFVKPKYRGGRYKVTVFDSQGRPTEAGEVPLLDTPGDSSPVVGGNDNVALRLLDSMERMRNQMQQPTPTPDPLTTFKQVNGMLREVRAEDSSQQGSISALVAAMMQSQTAAMQQMMQSQQAAAQAQNQILIELIKSQQSQQAAALSAPLPPPPPPPPENPLLNQVLTAALPLVLKRLLEPEISTKEMLSLLTSRNERSELDSMKEAINFLRSVQGDQKQASLIDELEKVQRVKELAANLVDGGGGGGGSPENFWTAISQLFANKDFAGNLGRMIGADIDQRRRQQQVQVQPPQLPAPQQAPQLPKPTVVHNPVPVSVAQPQPQPETPPPVGARRVVNGELHIMGENGKIVRFVENMPALCAEITTADEPSKRIQTVADALYQLRALDAWRPFVDATLDHVVKNEKDKALQALRGWLGMLIQLRLLEQPAAASAFSAFEEHWDSFYTAVAHLMGVQAATTAQAAPSAPSAPQPVEAAPAVSDSEDENEEGDDEEGEEDGDEDEEDDEA